MSVHGSIALVVLLSVLSGTNAGPSNARLLSRLQAAAAGQQEPCQPWSVPPSDRCAYVEEHASICYPDGGFQKYLAVHYCFFGPAWRWLSLLVLLAAALLAFAILLTVSERFFCPALELISDFLKLPPVVAGATLLSFGNGAPDTFTQMAAVGQEGSAAVGMALAEPLGGGMFASNVVFGLVVLIASKQEAIVPRWAFLKDVGFYLCSLIITAFMLADGKVTYVEAGIMCGLYVVYVCATFYTSRADEPLHADLALHEFPPQDGGIDAPDDSDDYTFESDVEHPEYIDATTSIREYDLEAQHSDLDHSSCNSSSPTDSEHHPLPAAAPLPSAQPTASSKGGSRTLQALLSWRHSASGSGLREPLLLAIDESPVPSGDGQAAASHLSYEANSSGDTVRACRAGVQQQGVAAAAAAAAGHEGPAATDGTHSGTDSHYQQQQQQQQPDGFAPDAGDATGSCTTDLPPPAFVRLSSTGMPSPLSPQLGGVQQQQQSATPGRGTAAAQGGRRSFSEGVRVSLPGSISKSTSPSPGGPDRTDASVQGWSPRAASDSMLPRLCLSCGGGGVGSSPRTASGAVRGHNSAAGTAVGPLLLLVPPSPGGVATPRRRTHDGTWKQYDEAGASVPLSPHLQQLQQQHFAEQVELLEQQAAEHDALLAEQQEQQDVLKAGGMSFKHKLQYPFVQLLSCTMPRVGTGGGHHYTRWRACLLPLTVPLLWCVADSSLLLDIGWRGLLLGAACAAVGSCIIWATYPASAVPRKALKGVFAVLAFVQAIVWLNISASALVQVCVVVGVVFGLQPALLGATVLAWGNSVPDLINNTAMAHDGFPSMAVAACFASPLFTLLVGMGGALAYGTVLHGGPLTIPVDGPLMVMAGFSIVNMVQHLVVVPLVHRYKMKPTMAVITFLFYACFNVVYVLATVGVIKIREYTPAA